VLLLVPIPSRQGDEGYCRRLGVAGRVAKPVRRAELRQALTAALAGKGTTTFAVPVTPSDGVDGPGQSALRPAARAWRVLIADEEPARLRRLTRLLDALGHQTTTLPSPADAVAQLHRGTFDVALFNVAAPEMASLDAIARLRLNEAHDGRRVPAVALTDLLRAEERTRCLRAGFDAVVTRPVQPRELIAALAQVMAPPRPLSGAVGL
jgi:CheY-like chemotaxis protein